MAIYHLEAKVISRRIGRSAVAAAAYMSCSQIYNDYDGVQHDYTRKHGLVWQQVFLPPMAPESWQDRAVLWNAVEEAEKSKDSRLAREFVIALPIELGKDENVALISDFVQSSFIAEGMCADISIHDTDGHNPHAHVLLTVRPLNENGTWQYKTEKEYLCVRGDEERGFTVAEFKTAQNEGWEKQYPYLVNDKKMYMATFAAEEHGYERVSKYPKSTKFGRQNPITERWNSEEQLVRWRAEWAETANRYLERANIQESIDHRSHAERGLKEQPTIHEGTAARILEKMGFISDRCEINRQIREDNKLLHELKTTFDKLMKTIQMTLPAIAEALEKARQKIFVFCYQLGHIQKGKSELSTTLKVVKPDLKRYASITKELKAMSKQRKALTTEKEATPVLHVAKHIDLSRQIAALTEKMEERKDERQQLIYGFNKTDDAGMKEVSQRVDGMEVALTKLEQSEIKYATELDTALGQYRELTVQAAEYDTNALESERQALRPDIMQKATQRLRTGYGSRYDGDIAQQAWQDVAKLLEEKTEEQLFIYEQLKQVHQEMKPQEVVTHRKKQYEPEI